MPHPPLHPKDLPVDVSFSSARDEANEFLTLQNTDHNNPKPIAQNRTFRLVQGVHTGVLRASCYSQLLYFAARARPHMISRPVPSTARPPLRLDWLYYICRQFRAAQVLAPSRRGPVASPATMSRSRRTLARNLFPSRIPVGLYVGSPNCVFASCGGFGLEL